MRILVVGATGTIGAAVTGVLDAHGHTVFAASRHEARFRVDVEDLQSIEGVFETLRSVDAVVCTVGRRRLRRSVFDDPLSRELRRKLVGQMNVVSLGLAHVRRCIVLTAGALPEHLDEGVSRISGTAVERFVRTTASDVRQPRINVVVPPLVHETARQFGLGGSGVPAGRVAELYRHAIESSVHGQTLRMA